jgi:UDP-N-acetyl-D-glucosamine dehydrogenase
MLDHHGCRWHSAELDAALLRRTDCTVILADHEGFDWRWVVEHSKLVVDTRNATREIGAVAKIYRL